MRWSFIVFFLTLLVVLGAANHYVLRWAERAFSIPRRLRLSLAVVLYASLAMVTLGRFLDRAVPELSLGAALAVSFAIQLAVLISAILLLAAELVSFAARIIERYRSSRKRAGQTKPALASEPATEAPLVPRRAVLARAAAGSAFLVGSSSSLYGTLVGRHDYTIEELAVRLPGLSKALDGFTIVQLSDIHVGSFVGRAELEAGFEFVRRAKPDLVVLTGDLIDHDASFAETLGRFARRLAPLAREGVTAITGNHDYYAGVIPTVRALERGGARVLRNEGRVIGGAQGFALLGVDDVMARRFSRDEGPDLKAAVDSLPQIDGRHAARDLPRVLLCHNPSFFEQAAGKVELQLSGHTHGGQVNLVVRPGELFMKNGWIAGLYERSGSKLYINRGFGTAGPPARVGAPPEISRVVLTSA
ncbi:MAG TPA: metallophosphoesterase [Polyangiaceae bacterium]